MTILGARSFDCGNSMLSSSDVYNEVGTTITASATKAKTGAYSLRYNNASSADRTYYAQWAMTGTPANPAVSVWVNLDGNYQKDDAFHISFVLGTGELVEARWNATTHTLDGYVNGVLFVAGAFTVTQNDWFHVQFRALIANVGELGMLIDGHQNFYTTGDTQPGAATGAAYTRIGLNLGDGTSASYIDDLVFGYGAGYLGCLYCEDIRPDGDSAVQWTPSAGGSNYATVDEVPISDTDYNYTGLTGQKDLLSLGAFNNAGKTIAGVGTWVRTQMVDAAGDSIIVGVSSGGVEDDTTHAITAAFAFYHHFNETDPNTGAAWAGAGVNAALLKYESVIT